MNRPSFRRFISLEEDGSPSLIELEDYQEEMFHHFEDIEFSLSSDPSKNEGIGDLYITSGRIIWIANKNHSSVTKAFDFDIPYIILHALSHDENTYAKPCLYCQLDNSSESDLDEEFGECFFVPPNDSVLLKLFESFSEAAQRNPDADVDDDDFVVDGDGDELIYNIDEVRLGAEEARRLEHLESVFNVPLSFLKGDVPSEDQFRDSNDGEELTEG